MKKLTAIILGVVLISLASSLYAGETLSYDLSDKTQEIYSLNYSVVDGSNDWFDISYSQATIYITPNLYLETDEYTIIFEINGLIEKKITTSSSGSGIKYYIWECSSWGDCIDDYATRTCIKKRVYYKTDLGDKPMESIKCTFSDSSSSNSSENSTDPIELDCYNCYNTPEPNPTPYRIVGLSILTLLLILIVLHIIRLMRKEDEEY